MSLVCPKKVKMAAKHLLTVVEHLGLADIPG
jgi:hypothetical protein